MNPYSYPNGGADFGLHLKQRTSRFLRYAVDFPSAHPTPYEETNTVWGEYFQPQRSDPSPLAILVHGWGDRSVIPCRLLARDLVRRGIACFILYLVFHSSRMPKAMRNRLPALSSEEWFEGYRISVINVRQVVDWASGRAEIDREHIAVVGISLGGLISAIAMGIDKRVAAGVFVIAGGNSEEITWKSRSKAIRKQRTCTEAECHHVHTYYPQYLVDVAEKGYENVTPVRACFLTDALTFASYLRGRPVLMINALWDEVIPRQATLGFWEACSKPAIAWFPAGHAAIWLWYPFISRKIGGFLRSTFGMQGR
jgi:pimeloyl-ACP methyl ester carboxylesterase